MFSGAVGDLGDNGLGVSMPLVTPSLSPDSISGSLGFLSRISLRPKCETTGTGLSSSCGVCLFFSLLSFRFSSRVNALERSTSLSVEDLDLWPESLFSDLCSIPLTLPSNLLSSDVWLSGWLDSERRLCSLLFLLASIRANLSLLIWDIIFKCWIINQ